MIRRVEDILCGTMSSRALIVALELGIFRCLGAGPLVLSELQERAGLSNGVGLLKLMDVLCALDLVEMRDGRYHLAATCLDPASHDYYGHFVSFFADQYRVKTPELLVRHIRDGERLHGAELGDQAWQTYMQAMEGMACISAEPIARALRLERARTLLDLGGGPGTYAEAFCRVYPDMKVTIRDLAPSLEFARSRVDAKRVVLVPGSFDDADLGGPFDVIFVSHTIHLFDMDAVCKMLEAGRRALNPGGRLVLRDFFMDDARRTPLMGVLVSLCMWGEGAAYSYAPLEQALLEAGYRATERVSFCDAAASPAALGSLLVATTPPA